MSSEEFTSCQQTQKCGICVMSFLILILKCKQESLCTNEIQSDRTHTHTFTLSLTYSKHRRRLLQSLSKNTGNHSCKHRPKQKDLLLVSARPAFTYWMVLGPMREREREERVIFSPSHVPLSYGLQSNHLWPSFCSMHLLGWTVCHKGSPTSSGTDCNDPTCVWGHTCAP